MNLLEAPNRKGDKIFYYYDFGRGKGQRPTTGIFTYTKPKDQIQRNHNKQALALLEVKKSQLTIEHQSIGSVFIPQHKLKANFVEYYEEYVKDNTRKGNRHLANSFTQFKLFIGKDFISPTEITENFCKRFRQFLLDKFNGETPKDYYSRFKWALNAAETDKYFQKSPSAKVQSKSKPSARLKENLEVEEYLKLLRTPCRNQEVRAAAIFSCYTGLRWCDVKKIEFSDLREGLLTTRIIQAKTGQPVVLTLHPIALAIIEEQRLKAHLIDGNKNLVFKLPSANGANKIVDQWVSDAGIQKYITWSCFRLSFSILLQDENVDDATVACLLGHTTTAQVRKVYRRHRPKDQLDIIRKLPSPIADSHDREHK